jgi:hypothetical protein
MVSDRRPSVRTFSGKVSNSLRAALTHEIDLVSII